MTLGSLFDGIGGFPLAGVMCGITPVWSSEIEPFPMKVTAARFPEMKQLGSVTEINGAEIEPVDIITFGSPCQDLSVAGKQLGIHEGQRSNLFFEAVRIIKEMREADEQTGRTDEHIRPRFAVWENVPGAFSSNKGADFQAVIQALASIRENGVSIPQPKKWGGAGCVVGNGWSIAWRVYDAQYWGVPQRRKRIYLVADFASERAGEILFEREGVSGDSAESGASGKGTAADAEGGAGGSGAPICLNFQGNKSMCSTTQDGTAYSLMAMHGHDVHVIVDKVKCLNPWDCQSKRQHDIVGAYPTLQAYNGGGGRCDGVVYPINTMVATRGGKDDMRTCFGIGEPGDPQFTISAAHEHGVCYALQGNGIDRADTAGCNGCGWRENEMYTLNTVDRPAIAFQQNQRDEVRDMGEQAGALTAQPGVHNQNYLCYPEIARTLAARHDSSPCIDRGQNVVCYEGQNVCTDTSVAFTLQAGRMDQQHIPSVVHDARGNGDGKTYPTLTGDHQNRVTDYTAVCVGNGQLNQTGLGDKTGALNCMHDQQAVIHKAQPPRKYIVRRLTPTECARLQGFPDWWCEGLGGSDSAIYKAYGNGLALPCAYDVLRRIAKEYD